MNEIFSIIRRNRMKAIKIIAIKGEKMKATGGKKLRILGKGEYVTVKITEIDRGRRDLKISWLE